MVSRHQLSAGFRCSALTYSYILHIEGVGQVVKGLRKHAQSEIQVQAKAAFSRWKENFKHEIKMAPEPAVPGDVNVERKRQEAHDPKEDKIESQKPDPQSYTPNASTNAETTSSGTSSGLEG